MILDLSTTLKICFVSQNTESLFAPFFEKEVYIYQVHFYHKFKSNDRLKNWLDLYLSLMIGGTTEKLD